MILPEPAIYPAADLDVPASSLFIAGTVAYKPFLRLPDEYSARYVKGVLRQITINDLPVGRSVDEVFRLVQVFQFTDKHG